jgi:hypothetical protein
MGRQQHQTTQTSHSALRSTRLVVMSTQRLRTNTGHMHVQPTKQPQVAGIACLKYRFISVPTYANNIMHSRPLYIQLLARTTLYRLNIARSSRTPLVYDTTPKVADADEGTHMSPFSTTLLPGDSSADSGRSVAGVAAACNTHRRQAIDTLACMLATGMHAKTINYVHYLRQHSGWHSMCHVAQHSSTATFLSTYKHNHPLYMRQRAHKHRIPLATTSSFSWIPNTLIHLLAAFHVTCGRACNTWHTVPLARCGLTAILHS